jgi:hypothetical protein
MQSAPVTNPPRPVRSAVAAGLRVAARFCWDCAFPSPEASRLPDEFRPRPTHEAQRQNHAQHLSELSRNWPRWPV